MCFWEMEQGTHARTSTNTCNSFAVHAFPSSRQAFACSLLRIPNSWLHGLAATCLLAWWTFGACMLRDITHRIESAVLQIYFKRQHGYDINTININFSFHYTSYRANLVTLLAYFVTAVVILMVRCVCGQRKVYSTNRIDIHDSLIKYVHNTEKSNVHTLVKHWHTITGFSTTNSTRIKPPAI